MSNNVTIRVLSIYLLFTASASLIIIATASSTTSSENVITVPPRAYNAEEATVTAAPELKRQDSTNYCTEWSIVDGDPVGCYAPNTCLFTSVAASGFAYCGISGSTYGIATVCSDYTALTVEPPYETLHCPSTYPYCHTLSFIAGSSDTYTMFGCDTWEGPTSIAYPIAGAAAVTIQSSASLVSSTGFAQNPTFETAASTVPSTSVQYAPTSTTPQSTVSPSSVPASQVASGVDTAAAIGGALGGFASVVLALLAVYKVLTRNKKPLNP